MPEVTLREVLLDCIQEARSINELQAFKILITNHYRDIPDVEGLIGIIQKRLYELL